MLKKPKIIKGNLILTRVIREKYHHVSLGFDCRFFCYGCKYSYYSYNSTIKCRISSRSTPEDEATHSLCCKTTPITKQGKIVYIYVKEESGNL